MAGFKSQPLGHWTKKKMREFMEAFVISKGIYISPSIVISILSLIYII